MILTEGVKFIDTQQPLCLLNNDSYTCILIFKILHYGKHKFMIVPQKDKEQF